MTIEKYEGSFSKDEIGVTQIPNKTIQLLCKNAEALAMYVFILSLPASWNLHYKHLMRELDMSKDKVYQCLNLLKGFGLLSTTEIREQGRFVRNHYQVHLRPRPPVTETTEKVTSPFPCLPEAAKPDPVNPEAYKTKTLEIIETNKTNTTTTNTISNENEVSDTSKNREVVSSAFIISEEVDGGLLRFNRSYELHAKDNREFLMWCKFTMETVIKADSPEGKLRVLKAWIKNGGLKKPSGYDSPKAGAAAASGSDKPQNHGYGFTNPAMVKKMDEKLDSLGWEMVKNQKAPHDVLLAIAGDAANLAKSHLKGIDREPGDIVSEDQQIETLRLTIALAAIKNGQVKDIHHFKEKMKDNLSFRSPLNSGIADLINKEVSKIERAM